MKVAVIGGGLFGCTTAITLSREGHDVHLFEKGPTLLGCASGLNQFRLHEGYHYPRSPETVRECKEGLRTFREEYGSAVIDGGIQYYAIASEGSKTSPEDYLKFCGEHGLGVVQEWGPVENVDLCLRVREARLDYGGVFRHIKKNFGNLKIALNSPASIRMRDEFDRIVIATYASTNEVAIELDAAVEPFQYEVCEKPVLKMPENWKDTGVVILDGPFCSLDPFGRTDLHLMGHVEHAIHHSNTGLEPEVPDHLKKCLHRSFGHKPSFTKFPEFLEAGKKYIPDLKYAEHIGSMFVIRAVLPDRDDTDERPTLVEELDDQVIRVFSGKLPTAVTAARSIGSIIERDATACAA